MDHFLIDNSILAAAALTALLLVRFGRHRKVGAWASFLLLFAPLVTFLNMWAHTVAVLMVQYARYRAGSFQYNFNCYGLLLLGIVFIVVSGINIDGVRKRIRGDVGTQALLYWLNLATALLFLPLMPLNPIALLPVLGSLLSSLTLWAIRARQVPTGAALRQRPAIIVEPRVRV